MATVPAAPLLDTSQAAVERVIAQACGEITAGKSLVTVINRRIKDTGALRLASAIQENSRTFAKKLPHLHYELHSLQLRGNEISDAGAIKIAEALQTQRSLLKLDFSDNMLRGAGASGLADTADVHVKLKSLWVGRNRIGDMGAVAIASSAARHVALQHVDLQANGITDAGAAHMSEACRQPQSALEVLDLGNNGVTEAGAGKLASALEESASLRTLILSGNSKIGDAGAGKLAAALRGSCKLKELDLTSSDIGDAGASLLAQALESNSFLRMLNLAGNRIGNAGAKDLLQGLVRQGRRDSTCILRRSHADESANGITCFSEATAENLGAAARATQTLANQGITLFWLLKFFKENVGTGSIDAKAHDTETVVYKVVMPLTYDYGASFSGGRVHSNGPTVYVVHSWRSLFRDLISSAAAYATGIPHPPLDPDDLFYTTRTEALEVCFWIDVFAVNQNLVAQRPVGHHLCETDKFALVLDQVKRRNGLVLLAADREVSAMRRMWCMHEIYVADTMGLPLEVGWARKPGPTVESWAAGVKQAEISSKADAELIFTDIKVLCGPVTKFDKRVREVVNQLVKDKCEEVMSRLTEDELHELDHVDFQERGQEGRLSAEEQEVWDEQQAAEALKRRLEEEAKEAARLAQEAEEAAEYAGGVEAASA
mmetsp:Transcript_13277/g.30218  ORF Transcript_13277/g.30218 Transcript_13277/m.30218 type:complete len:659 (+) Transcript_13277:80-2056(+)